MSKSFKLYFSKTILFEITSVFNQKKNLIQLLNNNLTEEKMSSSSYYDK